MKGIEGETLSFVLNGERVEAHSVSTHTTLLDWLRRHGRAGTKCGCNEGDCGACTVALLDSDAAGRPAWRAINSCIALLPMFAGREMVTVEGVARAGEDLIPCRRPWSSTTARNAVIARRDSSCRCSRGITATI